MSNILERMSSRVVRLVSVLEAEAEAAGVLRGSAAEAERVGRQVRQMQRQVERLKRERRQKEEEERMKLKAP